MRYIRLLCIAIFAVALISVAIANRGLVSLRVLPEEIASYFTLNPVIDLPLFVVVLGSVLVGLMVGFIWEWMREHSVRKAANNNQRELNRLRRENKALRMDAQTDEVQALLDGKT